MNGARSITRSRVFVFGHSASILAFDLRAESKDSRSPYDHNRITAISG